MSTLSLKRLQYLLRQVAQTRVLVLGDVMLDQYLWGRVMRISPEAPVPIVEMISESFMPGGAANVARNLTALGASVELFGMVGHDHAGRQLHQLLKQDRVGCDGLLQLKNRLTCLKTRIIAHQQQVVRVDREQRTALTLPSAQQLLDRIEPHLNRADAVIVGDYAKGTVTQFLIDQLKRRCQARGVWLSLDPKPAHHLNLSAFSLITPNRKEAFELAGCSDGDRGEDPLNDDALIRAADQLIQDLKPALLLITLGEQGMLLCRRGHRPFHIPTVTQEVFDVSGAGDTVIASFTAAIAAGASPIEAAIVSNHAAGVVVGKKGTATVSPAELCQSMGGHA
jgi:D-beta-D-heptose 7-phosphate kinase/D-beta-D-heptose 1-phosphate adenosyltransferase